MRFFVLCAYKLNIKATFLLYFILFLFYLFILLFLFFIFTFNSVS
jgi:hypothetical protein